jgi:hypothetical protein
MRSVDGAINRPEVAAASGLCKGEETFIVGDTGWDRCRYIARDREGGLVVISIDENETSDATVDIMRTNMAGFWPLRARRRCAACGDGR